MLQCRHCHTVTGLSEAGARYLGWRLFEGSGMTGKPLTDVACPVCSGRKVEQGKRVPVDGQLPLDLDGKE